MTDNEFILKTILGITSLISLVVGILLFGFEMFALGIPFLIYAVLGWAIYMGSTEEINEKNEELEMRKYI